MTDPVKAHLIGLRDRVADLTDAIEAAISEWDRRDSLQLDLEQTETAAYHARVQELRAARADLSEWEAS